MNAVKHHGFHLNEKKTTLSYRKNKPEAVGLELSRNKPRLPQSTIDKVMDILNECHLIGCAKVQECYDLDAFGNRKKLKPSIEGRIRWVEKYGHSEVVQMWKLYNKIDWSDLVAE